MEIVFFHTLSVAFYSGLLVYILFKRLKVDILFLLAVLLSTFWLFQSIINNLGSDSYYLNYYSIILSLFGWLFFLQQTYSKIPNINFIKFFSVYGVNLLLILIFLFQYRIDHISQTLFFDDSTLYLAGFIMAIAMLFYLENIIRCMISEFRYSYKHLLFALTVMALINLLNFYYLLAYKEPNSKFHYLTLLVHIAIPVYLFISLIRIPKIKISLFMPSETGHAQYFMILTGSGMMIAGLMQLFDFYFSQVRSDYYQSIFLIFVIFIFGMLVLSNSFRTEISLYLKSYFYGDRNDYKKEWERISQIIRDEEGINVNILKYYSDRLNTDNAALYIRKGAGLKLSSKLNNRFPDLFPEGNVYLDKTSHIGSNMYGIQKNTKSNLYELYIKLSIGDSEIGLCWLKFKEKPMSKLDSASLQLCQTVSTEFAIRLRELEQKAEIIRQQKLSGFNKTVTFLAHDLKNIAAQQQLAIENFGKYRDDPEFLDDFNETIKHSTQKLRELISQFRYKSLNVNKKLVTFEKLIDLLQQKVRLSGERIVLSYNNPEDREVRLSSDIFIVAENLLKNSLEASKKDRPVHINVTLESSNLELIVKDSGKGMSKEFIEKELFEPFISTKKEYGLGVGMYHVKTTLDSMNATIVVNSKISKGTTITLVIPV